MYVSAMPPRSAARQLVFLPDCRRSSASMGARHGEMLNSHDEVSMGTCVLELGMAGGAQGRRGSAQARPRPLGCVPGEAPPLARPLTCLALFLHLCHFLFFSPSRPLTSKLWYLSEDRAGRFGRRGGEWMAGLVRNSGAQTGRAGLVFWCSHLPILC